MTAIVPSNIELARMQRELYDIDRQTESIQMQLHREEMEASRAREAGHIEAREGSLLRATVYRIKRNQLEEQEIAGLFSTRQNDNTAVIQQLAQTVADIQRELRSLSVSTSERTQRGKPL